LRGCCGTIRENLKKAIMDTRSFRNCESIAEILCACRDAGCKEFGPVALEKCIAVLASFMNDHPLSKRGVIIHAVFNTLKLVRDQATAFQLILIIVPSAANPALCFNLLQRLEQTKVFASESPVRYNFSTVLYLD